MWAPGAVAITDWLPLVLQTGDPLFPTGAYAHSLGLEDMARLGVVRDETTLAAFLHDQVVPALAEHELPYLRFAWSAAQNQDLPELCALDAEINAWKLGRELREASLQLGNRRLKMLLQLAPTPLLENYAASIGREEAIGHHLTVCGLQFTRSPLEAALAAYFYQALAGYCTAALKLIRIGQEGCQRALHAALAETENAILRSISIPRTEAGWFNPLLEIASMRHERANERLFIS